MNVLRLIRLPNLIILILTIWGISKFVIHPHFIDHEILSNLTGKELYLVLFICVCIGAGGYVYNDILDQKSDSQNQKRLIVGHSITRKLALLYYIFLTLAPLPAVLSLDLELNTYYFSLTYIILVLLLFSYNTYLKKLPLIGNVLIAILCSFAVALPYLLESKSIRALAIEDAGDYALLKTTMIAFVTFSFIANLIRELVKDVEDLKGDQHSGFRTFPVLFGLRKTKQLVLIFESILLFCISFYMWLGRFNVTLLIMNMVILMLPLLYIINKTRSAKSEDYGTISQLFKFYFLCGLVAIVINSQL